MSPLPAPPRFECLEAVARRYPVIEPTALATCIQLLQTCSAVSEAFDAQYARHGIARGRFQVLVLLYRAEAGGLTPAELAEQSGVTRAAMTGLVDALVEGGLVVREDDPSDRRTYHVRLTDRGHEFLHEMFPDHFRRLAAFMGSLTASEQRTLRRLLDKVVQRLPAVADAHPRLHERRATAASDR